MRLASSKDDGLNFVLADFSPLEDRKKEDGNIQMVDVDVGVANCKWSSTSASVSIECALNSTSCSSASDDVDDEVGPIECLCFFLVVCLLAVGSISISI